jgi:hypothetical protein
MVLLLALGIVGWKVYELGWPLIDSERTVTQGSYRGLKIGETKAEVVSELYSPFQHVRLEGYEVDGRTYEQPLLSLPSAPLSASDKWFLGYPGIHKETIVLAFESDRLASIRYRRDAFAP